MPEGIEMLSDEGKGRASEAARGGPATILLVDDDRSVLATLERVLKGSGSVAACDNGDDAVSRVRGGGVDVGVSDIEMAGMSGLELLRAIRAFDADLPVVVLTGRASVESAAEAIEHGVFRYLTKPFEAETIRKTVQQAA